MEHKTITEFQLVDINRLVPYINNARTHSPEQINKLRASLREFGFVNPIIVDRDYNVLAGHGRLIGAKAEGYKEVPCVFVDEMTEAQKKAYIIADNRMAMDAGWDEELLRVEIESLQGMDFDPLLTGFDEKELADLFADDSGSEARDDDFDLTAALELADDGLPNQSFGFAAHEGLDCQTFLRCRGNDGKVAYTLQTHCERSRNRCGGEREYVNFGAQTL